MGHCQDIDCLLTPYVDGEASAAERDGVDAHLAACAPCRQRAAVEAAVRQVLRTRAETLCCEAPEALRARCLALGNARHGNSAVLSAFRCRAVPLLVAASLTLALGGILVYGLSVHSSTALAAQLALDHMKCFALSVGSGPVDVRATESGIQRRYGWQIRLPQQAGPEDLRLVGARRCFYGAGRIAHVMYRVRGQPVSLFMLPDRVRPSATVSALGHEAIIWSTERRTFVLLGHESRGELERLAAYLGDRVE